ncbi:MAG: LVIVD repeat-containing protein [Nitrospinota bacterium]
MDEARALNMRLVGYHDLEKRPAFKLALQVVDGRWYLYTSQFWCSGWSILDVTDPSRPEFVKFVEGPENTWTLQVQVAEGKMITSLERIFSEEWGHDPTKPFFEGIYTWDVSEPREPRRLSQFKTGHLGTHRNYYDGGGYVHCAAAARGYGGLIYRIVDIQDPERPVEAGRWALPEQWTAGGGKPSGPYVSLHGPPYVEGDRAYLSYGSAGMVILDISDLSVPKLVSRLDVGPALGSWLGCHTVVPYPSRKLAVINGEAINEDCDEPVNYTCVVDLSNEANPRVISLFPIPVPPEGAPYRNFCQKGGRFGPHNQHHPQHHPDLESRDDRIYLTYFNAGLRVYDLTDPYLPREIGWYVPPDPKERLGLLPKKLVCQTEDVLVDRRGYIYITDKNWGIHILEFTGDGGR